MNTIKNKQPRKVNYGQDMPGIIIATSILAIVLIVIAIWQYHQYALSFNNQNLIASIILFSIAVLFLFIDFVGIWSSRYGKLKLKDKVLSKLNFQGSESILDIGCGRGLLLVEAAKHIPKGKATGVDLWLGNLEFKNTPQMVLENAKIEGVSDRTEVLTADAQALPFNDNTFDVVMTSLMMHHISDINTALHEMVRVLKPGGTLVIADVNSIRYAKMLQSLGLVNVETHYATRLFLVPAYIVKGEKTK
jgi:SAM-dependent methyltransferase